ncbi:MAG: type II toxin-antitoxin system prevent-host-death family antitoxin [Burkholderiales bacterium]|nr:type II toxin-antitoxin system prevent-host-death family antitoxin [Burkholderiales bacterium]
MVDETGLALKNRFGAVLARAMRGAVAIERHGRVVAYLVPASEYAGPAAEFPADFGRAQEERLLALCASGDLDPALWRQHGPAFFMAGLATMLASARGFPREPLLALARKLYPGMADAATFARWLERSPVRATGWKSPTPTPRARRGCCTSTRNITSASRWCTRTRTTTRSRSTCRASRACRSRSGSSRRLTWRPPSSRASPITTRKTFAPSRAPG